MKRGSLPNFKLPTLLPYDGRGDPENHLHAFISAFRLYCVSDSVICRIFPVFLQETARKWFCGLESRSIFSLGELVNKFIHRFISSRPTTKTSAYLLNIQQNLGQSLRSYVQRFQDKSVQIPDPNEKVIIAVFTNGFIVGELNTEVHKKYLRTLRELWQKVEKGIQSEDLNRINREAQIARSGPDSRKKKESSRGDPGTTGGFQSLNQDR
nr:uncharacterized protein LOC113737360 [Coffea arabica]